MDKQIRKLERLASQGDEAAENKLYRIAIRTGSKDIKNYVLSRYPKLLKLHYLKSKELIRYRDKYIFPDQLEGLEKLAEQFASRCTVGGSTRKPIKYLSEYIHCEFGVVTGIFDNLLGDIHYNLDHFIKNDSLIVPEEFYFLKNFRFGDYFKHTKFTNCLDLSACSNLQHLSCTNLRIKNLKLPNTHTLVSVKLLHMSSNNLDLNNHNQIKYLTYNYSKLTKLDLKNLYELKQLECHGNKLTELDLSNCPNLEKLECQNNHLTRLDLTNNPKLYFIDARENKLEELDLSKCSKLNCLRSQIDPNKIKFSESIDPKLKKQNWFY